MALHFLREDVFRNGLIKYLQAQLVYNKFNKYLLFYYNHYVQKIYNKLEVKSNQQKPTKYMYVILFLVNTAVLHQTIYGKHYKTPLMNRMYRMTILK